MFLFLFFSCETIAFFYDLKNQFCLTFALIFAKAKVKANTVIEIVIVNEVVCEFKIEIEIFKIRQFVFFVKAIHFYCKNGCSKISKKCSELCIAGFENNKPG